MTSPLSGVPISDIGGRYDLALGYDDGTEVKMVGYVMAPESDWQETTDLSDNQRLVQIASPNSTDRFTFYPQVSQGDWSGGEGQVYFTNPSMYYSSDGVDATQPGRLQLLPGGRVAWGDSAYFAGAFNTFDTATDGLNWVVVESQNTVNIVENETGTVIEIPFITEAVQAAETPAGIFIATTGVNSPTPPSGQGIYQLSTSQWAIFTHWTNDLVREVIGQSIAWYNDTLYYATTTQIKKLAAPLGDAANSTAGNVIWTRGTYEQNLTCLGNYAGGIMWSTGSVLKPVSPSRPGPVDVVGDATAVSILYTYDGNTITRVADILGMVREIRELDGVAYILTDNYQRVGLSRQFTLYAFQNGTLTLISDRRSAAPDFQAVNADMDTQYYQSLATDGRYLYIAWPGLATLMYDPRTGAFFRYRGTGGATVGALRAHRVVPTASVGVLETLVSHNLFQPLNVPFSQFLNTAAIAYDQPPVSGTLTTSFFDFGTPSAVKAYRGAQITFAQPVTTDEHVEVRYRMRQQDAWSAPLPTQLLPDQSVFYTFPQATKGFAVQLLLTLVPSTAATPVSPVLQSLMVKATAGRVWNVTVACRAGQKRRGWEDSQDDTQGVDSTELLANIINAYQVAAGKVVLFVPDPTAPNGVSQVNAVLEQYQRDNRATPVFRDTPSGYCTEGDVAMALVETL